MPCFVRLGTESQGTEAACFKVVGASLVRKKFIAKLNEYAQKLESEYLQSQQDEEATIQSIQQAGGVFFLSPRGCVMWYQARTLKSSQMQATKEFLARLKTAGCNLKKSRSAARRKG